VTALRERDSASPPAQQQAWLALPALLGMVVGMIPLPSQAEPLSARTGRLQLRSSVVEMAEPCSVTGTDSTWNTPHGLQTCDGGDLLAWGRCPADVIGPSARLRDGGVLAGELVSWDDREAVIANPLLGRVRLPTAAVLRWQATAAGVPLPSVAGRMSLQLVNGDRLVARDVRLAEESLTWQVWLAADAAHGSDAAAIAIPRERVQGIRTIAGEGLVDGPAAARRLMGEAAMLVGLEDGSCIAATDLQSAAGRSVLHLAGADPAFTSSITCPTRAIVGLVAVGPHAAPLAWLEPTIFEQPPRLGRQWPLTFGTSLTGDPLTVRGHRGFTGFGLHAAARLAYQLPPLPDRQTRYRLQASVALDDSAGQGGSVVIRVRGGDLQASASVLFDSGILRGGQAPLAIDLDIGRSRWLELEVDPTQDGDVLDRTIWLEPRLVTHQTSRTASHGPSPTASDASPETFPGHH
jgi:hypothetical protein